MRRAVVSVLVALAFLTGANCGDDDESDQSGSGKDNGQMILATTTSTQDSGLLDELVPRFEDESGCSVKTVAVGSGEALELGEQGNADALLVHSPEAEEEFMDGGHGVSRKAVMHNDFVVVGPADDAAKIKRSRSASDAFTLIAKAEAPFASRADESGTNTKELAIWEAAGIEPKGSWYIETGQGMGETLTIANQKQTYTLSDRGTWLATDNLDLELLVDGGQDLLNPYHAIVVKDENVNEDCAQEFSDWITSPETQKEIGQFGVAEFGEPLFVPDAEG
jgi:tungstate transport system substrate-binding protein